MKCPLCSKEMTRYENGFSDTRELGVCCQDCHVGVFVYGGQEKLDAVLEAMEENIVKTRLFPCEKK